MQEAAHLVPPCAAAAAAAVRRRRLAPLLRSTCCLPAAGRMAATALAAAVVAWSLLSAAANTTLCWGQGSNGRLGDGQGNGPASYVQALPVAVALPSGVDFASVAAGSAHTCALTADGKPYCWVSDTTGGRAPQPGCRPAGGHLRLMRPLSKRSSPAFAPLQGQGFNGELGTGSNATYSSTPLPVATDLSFSVLAAGGEFTCGLADGKPYCWVSEGTCCGWHCLCSNGM